MEISSLLVTVKLSLVVTPLLLLVSLPLARFLVFSDIPGKRWLEAIFNLPLVLPPTVLGFFLLMTMGPNSPLGAAWHEVTGHRLVFSFSGLVVASMVYSLPFAIQPLKTAFSRVDRQLIESARTLGLTEWATFRRVIVPNSLIGILSAAILVFAHTMGEFGVALMVGGSIPGKTKVASIAIFEHVEMLDYKQAWGLSLVLILLSYIVLVGLSGLEPKENT